MTLTMSHTGVTADGVKYTYSWVVNFDEVKNAAWIAVPSFIGFGKLSDVEISFHANAIIPIGIMFIVTTIETVGDISACVEGGMDRRGYRFRAFRRCYSLMILVHHLKALKASPNTPIPFTEWVRLNEMRCHGQILHISMGASYSLLFAASGPKDWEALMSIMPQSVLGGAAVK